jgi:hypothetical protein
MKANKATFYDQDTLRLGHGLELLSEQRQDALAGEFLRVTEECGQELALIADYVNEDHLGKSPDDLTLADIGDARALLAKLQILAEALGLDYDYVNRMVGPAGETCPE